MHNISSFSVIAKAGLLVGVMLALFLLSSSLYDYAHARTTTTETINYAEGLTSPVTAYTALDPEGDTVVWSLSGTDAGDFEITGGALTFENTPDYENPVDDDPDNIYEVTVQAADGSLDPTTESLIVNVINVDEDGDVTLSALQPQEETPLTATLTDADNIVSNTTKWRWSRSSSKTGTFTNIAGAINFTPDVSHTYIPKVDDVGMYLRATATYDDGEGEGKTAHMVSDNPVRAEPYENAAPVFKNVYDEEITGDIERSVAEDASPGDPVGDPVVATDDARDVLTYTLGGANASSFDIDSGTGQIKVGAGVTLDAETDDSYTVTVTATDPPGDDDEITVTIAVTDVDEVPMITAGDTAIGYPENGTNQVGVDYIATDPEDGNTPVRWSLSGADSGKFSIDTVGQLTFTDAPDFEAEADANSNNIYEVTVTATDSTGNTASRDVTVNVTNEEEQGTVTLLTLQPEAGTELMAKLTDPDDSISGLKWEWSRDGNVIPAATSVVYTPVNADEGSTLKAKATYTDGHGVNKMAQADSAYPVQQKDTTNQAPKFPDQDPDRAGDQSSSTSRTVAESAKPGVPIEDDNPVKAEDCDPDPKLDPPPLSLTT